MIVVHQEACTHLHRVLSQIRESGALAGVSLNPATPLETLAEARYHCDMVLIMSVNPGFGGQSFIETSTDKIRRARAYLPENVTIEVDGGVTEHNAGDPHRRRRQLARRRLQRLRRPRHRGAVRGSGAGRRRRRIIASVRPKRCFRAG